LPEFSIDISCLSGLVQDPPITVPWWNSRVSVSEGSREMDPMPSFFKNDSNASLKDLEEIQEFFSFSNTKFD
jgi:hypothetical protein